MRKWIAVVLSIAVLLLSGFVIIYLQRQASFAEMRHQIFCVRLVKGMNEQEVLSTLNEIGEFKYGTNHTGESYSEIFGNYTDISIIGQTTFHIMFLNGKYTNTYLEDFSDTGEIICAH